MATDRSAGSGAAYFPAEEGGAQPLVLAAICLIAGIAIGGFLLPRALHRESASASAEQTAEASSASLSPGTAALLSRLDAPVEIRYYRVLDAATVPESIQSFAGRVDKLIAEYQQGSGGKIKVTRFDAASYATAKAAAADGIKAFNVDRGEASYLGLAVLRNGTKQSLSQLSPDWEKALEPDLSRAIASVAAATESPAAAPRVVDAAVAQRLKESVPNVDSLSLEDGTRLLKQQALQEFKAAAQEVQADIARAEQLVTQAQANQSQAEIDAAMKQLQQAQASQTERMKEVAARLQTQIEALQQIKGQRK